MNYKELSRKIPHQEKIQDKSFQSMEVLLNELIAEEYNQWYQYFSVYLFLTGTQNANEVADKFKEWADDELNDHAVKLMTRLNELQMDFILTSPQTWSEYATALYRIMSPNDVYSDLINNSETEKHAIQRYTEAIVYAQQLGDFTTESLFKEILSDEEEHLSDILDLMKNLQ